MRKQKKKIKVQQVKVRDPAKFIFSFNGWETWEPRAFFSYRNEAQQFYMENLKESDILEEVWDWMKSNSYSKNDIAFAKKATGASKVNQVIAAICRLLRTGCPDYVEKHNEYWIGLKGTRSVLKPLSSYVKDAVQKAIESGKLSIEEKIETNTNVVVINIQEKMKEQLEPLMQQFDLIIDEFLSNENFDVSTFNPHKNILAYDVQIKPLHAKMIRDEFSSMLQESRAVLKGDDEYILESYSNLKSAKRRKDFNKLLEAIDTACQMVTDVNKITRKPRKKKELSKEKIVSKMNYKVQDAEYKVTSVNPVQIIDASEVWVFNTKYRKLGKYVADPFIKTLSVKGSTIVGFDTATSMQKTLRKPEEQLRDFGKLGKVALRTYMDTIRGKSSPLTGRINNDTIILKVV